MHLSQNIFVFQKYQPCFSGTLMYYIRSYIRREGILFTCSFNLCLVDYFFSSLAFKEKGGRGVHNLHCKLDVKLIEPEELRIIMIRNRWLLISR